MSSSSSMPTFPRYMLPNFLALPSLFVFLSQVKTSDTLLNETLMELDLKEPIENSSYVTTFFYPVVLSDTLSQCSSHWTSMSMIAWVSVFSESKGMLPFYFFSKDVLWSFAENEVIIMCPCSLCNHYGKWLATALVWFLHLFFYLKFHEILPITSCSQRKSFTTFCVDFHNEFPQCKI